MRWYREAAEEIKVPTEAQKDKAISKLKSNTDRFIARLKKALEQATSKIEKAKDDDAIDSAIDDFEDSMGGGFR